jgi:hypothetical protein
MNHLIPAASSALGGLIAAGGGENVILNDHTLVPLSVYVAGILLCCGVFWTVGKMIWQAATLITSALDRLERVEKRIDEFQTQCRECQSRLK